MEAQKLWQALVVVVEAANIQGEKRHLEIGVIRGTVWCAVTTPRGTSKRIISVRRARREEKDHYEQSITKKSKD